MKPYTPYSLGFTLHNFDQVTDLEQVRRVVRLLLALPPPFTPVYFDTSEPANKKIDFQNIEPLVKFAAPDPDVYLNLLLMRNKAKNFGFAVSSAVDLLESRMFNRINGNEASTKKGTCDIKALVSLVEHLTIHTNPIYGVIGERWDPMRFISKDFRVRLPNLSWGTVFGPAYIDLFGKERILGAPFYSPKVLDTGHILAFLSEHPFEETDESTKAEIRNYICKEAFMEGTRSVNFYKTGVTPDFKKLLYEAKQTRLDTD